MSVGSSCVLYRENGGRFAFGPEVMSLFDRYRQHKPEDTEAGGVLIGRLIPSTNDVVVDEALPPMTSDKRTRHAYTRPAAPWQALVENAWHMSNGVRNYLGEWHTHPEDFPTPSQRDLLNWARIAQKAIVEYEYFFFLIVGLQEIVVWEGNKSLQFTKLRSSGR